MAITLYWTDARILAADARSKAAGTLSRTERLVANVGRCSRVLAGVTDSRVITTKYCLGGSHHERALLVGTVIPNDEARILNDPAGYTALWDAIMGTSKGMTEAEAKIVRGSLVLSPRMKAAVAAKRITDKITAYRASLPAPVVEVEVKPVAKMLLPEVDVASQADVDAALEEIKRLQAFTRKAKAALAKAAKAAA